MFKLQFKDQPGRSIWLVGDKVSLGTDAGNDVALDGLGIKALHAEIVIEPQHLTLKSEAGSCFVNDLPVDAEYALNANDELRIGKERLLIVDPKQSPQSDDSAAAAQSESAAATGWSLIPDHSKLRERDFTIAGRSVLGRSHDCEFTVPYKLLSREHAVMWVQDGQLFIEDMGSANGCFVNGERIRQVELHNGDKLAFAKLGFTVKGPEQAPVKAPEVDDQDELNKTMVRPAVDLEAELQRARQQQDDGDLGLSQEQIDNYERLTNPSPAGLGNNTRWIITAVVLVVAAVGGVWFMA